jgi:hypothetical protein
VLRERINARLAERGIQVRAAPAIASAAEPP